MTLQLVDSFNRSNEATLSDNGKWTTGGISNSGTGLKLSSNVVVRQGSSGTFGRDNSYRNDITFAAGEPVIVAVTVAQMSSDGEVDIDLFAPSSRNGYNLVVQNTSFSGLGTPLIEINRADAGTLTALTSRTDLTPATGDRYALQIDGADVVAWRYNSGAWAEILRISESTYRSAFSAGLEIAGFNDSTPMQLDDFSVEQLDVMVPRSQNIPAILQRHPRGQKQPFRAFLVSTTDTPTSAPTNISVPSGVITVAADAPNASDTQTVPAAVITLAADAPTPSFNANPPSGVITLAATAPNVTDTQAVPSGVITVAADPPTVKFNANPPSGVITVAADAPNVSDTETIPSGVITFAATAPAFSFNANPASGVITLAAAGPTVSFASQVPSGVITLAATAPAVSDTEAIPSGVITLAADAPTLSFQTHPPSGVITVAADPPATSDTETIPSGIITLAASAPAVSVNTRPPSGVVTVAADAPTVSTPAIPSGVITFAADPPTIPGGASQAFPGGGFIEPPTFRLDDEAALIAAAVLAAARRKRRRRILTTV
jgi:hypothetical protein